MKKELLRSQILQLQKDIQLMKLLRLIAVLQYLKKRLKEDLARIAKTDIDLKNTPENGLDVWLDITTDNLWLVSLMMMMAMELQNLKAIKV